MTWRAACLAAQLSFLIPAPSVLAQSPPAPSTDCPALAKKAPTPSETGPSSGTVPGNAGSTGWSGGMGGTHMDTTPSGPAPGSEQQHPPTAQGLDPTKSGKAPDVKC